MKVVQAHGHYDLLHPGHIRHLKLASQEGYLVVTLTAGVFMSKPGHPLFTDEERLEMLRELRCIQRVEVIYSAYPYEAIDLVRPDIYVKGLEYEGRLPEQKYCEDRGIKVMFLGEKIYGSTTLAQRTGILSTNTGFDQKYGSRGGAGKWA